jgi:hypothetical protein
VKRTASLKDQLDATFGRIAAIDHSEFELRADFARYLCVLVNGYLEQSIRNACAEYAKRRAQPSVANFVVKATSRLSSLKASSLKEQLLAFDASWQDELDALIVDEVKDAIDSVVSLRHGIAHGQGFDITFERISRYYVEVSKAVVSIERMMGVD